MVSINTIKSWFQRGMKPTAAQFAAVFDSFWHKSEELQIANVGGLTAALNNKANSTDLSGKAALSHSHTKSDITDFAHTHQLSEISGLNTFLYELCYMRSYTLDFGTSSETVLDMNLMGTITVNRIETVNVAALYVTYGTAVIRHQITSNVVSFNVPDGATITWEIVRTNENQPACVGVRYTIQDNSNQNQQES